MNLCVLHHTDCGITRLGEHPGFLARLFGVDPDDLGAKAVLDPKAAVAVDVAAIKANPSLPSGFLVAGLVYDVATGLVNVVVPPRRSGKRRPRPDQHMTSPTRRQTRAGARAPTQRS